MLKTITLMGREIRVRVLSRDELLKLMRELGQSPDPDETVYGFFDQMGCTINLWSGLEEEAFKRTLLHELFHAMCSFSGFDCLLDRDPQLEEALCTLSENWLDLFKNKKFVEEMQ